MISMPSPSNFPAPETPRSILRVHIVGAGPVGLMLAALFQPMEGFAVHLYEKRRQYTRTRMVQLRDYLVADSVASYCTDYIDGESVEALFDASELHEGLAFRQSIPPDLMARPAAPPRRPPPAPPPPPGGGAPPRGGGVVSPPPPPPVPPPGGGSEP